MNTMKTNEEPNTLKEEVETVSKKLHELTDEELAQVAGGGDDPFAGLVVGGVYEGRYKDEVEYCKIAFINRDNNGVIDYWPGTMQGDHIQRTYPVKYALPGTFRSDFYTDHLVTIPWHDF